MAKLQQNAGDLLRSVVGQELAAVSCKPVAGCALTAKGLFASCANGIDPHWRFANVEAQDMSLGHTCYLHVVLGLY